MPLDNSLVLNSSATRDSGVLVSERTQQIALAAIDALQSRFSWHEMSDGDWDTVDAAIGQAITEILEIQAGGGNMVQIVQGTYTKPTTHYETNSAVFIDVDAVNLAPLITLVGGGLVRVVYTFTAHASIGSGTPALGFRISDGTNHGREFAWRVSSAVNEQVITVSELFWDLPSGNRNFKLQFRAINGTTIRVNANLPVNYEITEIA